MSHVLPRKAVTLHAARRVGRSLSLPGRVNVHSSFTLSVPEDSDLKINAISGSIEVKGVRGHLELESVSADVRMDGSPNRVEVNSVSGDFEGVLGTGMEELCIETVSGELAFR